MGGDIFCFLSEEDRVIKRGHEAKPRQITSGLQQFHDLAHCSHPSSLSYSQYHQGALNQVERVKERGRLTRPQGARYRVNLPLGMR